MKIVVDSIKTFRRLINALAAVADEVTFNITTEEITVRQIDPSRVALVDFALSKAFFSEWQIEKPTKLTVTTKDFMSLLRRTHKNDKLTITQPVENKLALTFTRPLLNRKFTLSLFQEEKETTPLPKISFTTKVVMIASAINQAIADIQLASNAATITVNNEKIVLTSVEAATVDALVEFDKGSEELLILEAAEQAKATFSLAYLSAILNAGSLVADTVTLQIATNMPLKLQFDVKDKVGTLEYFLAPRILPS